MIREYCDRCNGELGNTYYRTNLGGKKHTVEIKIDDSLVMDMLLCEECYKNTEYDIFEVCDWFRNKEQEEMVRLEKEVRDGDNNTV